ncbi:hypothetical protein CSOJ01_05437 [Colletotrichum sojae]|uniref:Uncharacterized protein n=1 Tax=Colletotrichum sojae TaxID=2175907 RepID=A0A8H6MWV4_9PEZI|nr:hypothetical protein CSOJ01_05437 [Colletotrichum sojae]
MFGGSGLSPSDYYNMLVRGSLPDTSARGGRGATSSNPISRPPTSTTSTPPASTTSVLTSTTSMPPIRGDPTEGGNNTNPAPPESGGHKGKDPSSEHSNDSEDMDVDEGEEQKIRREMGRREYRWRAARDSRSEFWSCIRCILPHPEEGSAIEEHKLWVYVFRTAAEAILFSRYDQNPRVLNAMCEMVDSLLDGEPVDQEDFDDYRRAEGAALDLYGVPFDAEAYRRLGYVESDEIDDSMKDIWKNSAVAGYLRVSALSQERDQSRFSSLRYWIGSWGWEATEEAQTDGVVLMRRKPAGPIQEQDRKWERTSDRSENKTNWTPPFI